MFEARLESRIENRAKELARLMAESEQPEPALVREGSWAGRAFRYSLGHPDYRTAFLRFIDVVPVLDSDEELVAHFRQYFCSPDQAFPPDLLLGLGAETGETHWLSPGARKIGQAAEELRGAIGDLAGIFVLGRSLDDALPRLEALRERGLAFSVDILGEEVVSEEEADDYARSYVDLLETFASRGPGWPALGGGAGELDWGWAPKINISVKPSALYSQMSALALETSVARARERLLPLFRKAVAVGAHITFDMELRELKGVYHALFRSLLEEEQFRDYPHFGIIIQSYLREAREDVENLLEWARRGERRFAVRLVKGAYRETEIVHAGRNSWSQPVLAAKTDTDAAYESLARLLLSGYPRVRLACASHNPRTIASVLELGREAKVPLKELEFQLIYGMADSLQSALVKMGLPVRVYTPFGGLVPGLGYLIRRLLEVGGRDSFLRDRFFEGREIDELVGPPDGTGDHASSAVSAAIAPVVPPLAGRALPPFANEPTLDWSREREREAMARALVRTREALPYRLAPVIGGQEVRAERSIHSTDPNDPARTIGVVSAAGREEALAAIRAAREAFAGWRRVPPAERADTLFRAAVAARELRYDLAALEVLEVGRSWSEADGDVCEAIDYLEYYGREMLRLAKPRRTAEVRGEVSHLLWEPAGVAAVIAPWNFPLAISMGMVSAALVTGSTVVYKPSSASPVVGSMILRVFERAGLPAGVLNFLPGSGGELGDVLVGAPEVALAAFTGSKEVGLHLIETAHRASEGSRQVTRVVCEMGGKNAAIVDTDAELDEAVREIVQSAFGYQGQKCSACSRLIVLEGIYDRLIARLVAATESLAMGPAEDPASFVGAVIDSAAREKILQYIEIGRHEAHLLLHREPPPGRGHTVPLAVFGEVLPHHRIAREEIFGPVLAVIRVGDFEEALAVANDSEYALTGSVFSRSPAHIEWARRELRVGSLYINRRCTGAIVGRHPFGGFRMSGVGTKAGGPDYLQQFMLSRTVVENTLRRGFAPE